MADISSECIPNNSITITNMEDSSQAQRVMAALKTYEKNGGFCSTIQCITSILKSLKLDVPKSFLRAILMCCGDGSHGCCCCSERISLEKLCLLVSEIEMQLKTSIDIKNENIHHRDISDSNITTSVEQQVFKVFLGGSCNPTTWRRDVAVPAMEEANITFFNPQVDEWKPELIEIEVRAKRESSWLLFVIDDRTRSVASLVEISYLACSGRNVILAVSYIKDSGLKIDSEEVQGQQLKDLNHARLFLSDLCERHYVPVFNDVASAVKCCCKAVLNGVFTSATLGPAENVIRGRDMELNIENSLLYIQSIFHTYDMDHDGMLSFDDVACACQSLDTSRSLETVKNMLISFNFDDNSFISLTDFFKIVGDLCHALVVESSPRDDWLTSSAICGDIRKSVYLGGSSQSTWRNEIAVPMLKQYGISFYNPYVVEEVKLVPMKAWYKNHCDYILYVIDSQTRCITSMIEAAGFIGKGRRIFLVIEHIPDNALIDGVPIGPGERKDLQRGRAYLADMATREGHSIFEDISSAITAIVTRTRETT